MTESLLLNFVLVFVIISTAILIAYKFRFCSIPLLIFLGVLLGPHAPYGTSLDFRLVEDTESLTVLSRLGILLLLFYLGLEFSASRVIQRGAMILKGGSIYVALNFLRGLALGWLFFHSWPETLVVAGITTVSSSAIITKLLVELKRTANPETELILGIMVLEDAFIAVYLSVISGYFLAQGTSLFTGLVAGLITTGFIVGILYLGRFVSPLFDRWLNFRSGEPLIVVAFTLLLIMAWLAEEIGVTEAVGALLSGLVLAETSHAKRLIQLVTPLRDLFGAVFFFSFGMDIDYRQFAPVVSLALFAAAATVGGNFIAGLLSAWVCGYRGRAPVNVACTIIARGEFAIIAAGLAGASFAAGMMPPLAALYVLMLAFVNPVLAKRSRWIYLCLEKMGRLFSWRKTDHLAG
uniref:Cation:proton antiporter n=1 Tax=Ammonifex degensii TaxID=42838 RepID=A0A7C2J0M4_9THEO